MQFNQLNKKAQARAVNDYQEGWLETHPNDPLDEYEIFNILSTDLIEDEYDDQGKLVTEGI
jgi:hypothetical protein